jgi:molybdate transport system substrate-binding protein
MKFLLIILLLFFTNATETESQSINVAAAANTQFVMRELKQAFEKKHAIALNLIIGSSGKLSNQIMNGAPYHIFLAGNEAYADQLYKNKYATEKPCIYAAGTAVLWTIKEIPLSKDLTALLDNQIATIAIASPKNAPYGLLAVNALEDAGLYEAVKEKIVYGNNVAQVNQYLSLHAVDAGITSYSAVHAPAMKNIGKWVYIPGYHIKQAMVKLVHSSTNERKATALFYDFLQSNTACEIFTKYGYFVN